MDRRLRTSLLPSPILSPFAQGNKVVVHNKINNLPGFTNYICNPICIRVKDDRWRAVTACRCKICPVAQ